MVRRWGCCISQQARGEGVNDAGGGEGEAMIRCGDQTTIATWQPCDGSRLRPTLLR
jgi:hypothetical protein